MFLPAPDVPVSATGGGTSPAPQSPMATAPSEREPEIASLGGGGKIFDFDGGGLER